MQSGTTMAIAVSTSTDHNICHISGHWKVAASTIHLFMPSTVCLGQLYERERREGGGVWRGEGRGGRGREVQSACIRTEPFEISVFLLVDNGKVTRPSTMQ